ncbi:hypothetical protein PFISCL1PPCAC_1884, partial [Pristionchus fissidentatus]
GGRRVAWLHGSATVGPHIQTGIVPIFDKRNTMEPITFTFTTPQPRPAAVAAAAAPSPWPAVGAAPALRPTDAYEAPYARPAAPLIISARSAFLPSSPTHHFPPYQSFPSSPSFSPPQFGREIEGVRHNAIQSWTQLKSAVADAGVDRDWRALWTKMSGVVEPYVAKMTQHLGSAINVALREQNKRKVR